MNPMGPQAGRGWFSDARGATAVEYALVAPLFLLLAFAVVEFSLAFGQYQRAEAAAVAGVRLAAVSNPVAPVLSTLSGDPTVDLAGTPCALATTCAFAPIVCTQEGCGGQSEDAGAFNAILAAMQAVMPTLTAANLQITYSYAGLGFVGRPGGAVPLISVAVAGIPFDFGPLSGLSGLAALVLPTASASLTAESMSSAGS